MADWIHAPHHRFQENGTYMLTAGTYKKAHLFNTPQKLQLLQDNLLSFAEKYGWHLHAWAVFINHYHFVGSCIRCPTQLDAFMQDLHYNTAITINLLDETPQRKVWHQYFDSKLTYQRSYLARLNYVINNPVRHGLVSDAKDYQWCSASSFEKNAPKPFQKLVKSFKSDQLNVIDDF